MFNQMSEDDLSEVRVEMAAGRAPAAPMSTAVVCGEPEGNRQFGAAPLRLPLTRKLTTTLTSQLFLQSVSVSNSHTGMNPGRTSPYH